MNDARESGINRAHLEAAVPNYKNYSIDIRDSDSLDRLFGEYQSDIALIVHAAAQPNPEWAATDPFTDFTVNANGTLTLLEMCRQHCPEAVFVMPSTTKVYGDAPNYLPLVEQETRYEVAKEHPYYKHGIDEQIGIDQTTHSLFGASKAAADLLVQEYGRYFGLKTAVFRASCLIGPNESLPQPYGFLSELMKCALSGEEYTIFGYKGKQVRDTMHTLDFMNMIWHFYQQPRPGSVYNAGGGRFSNVSVLEAIGLCEEITGNRMNVTYSEDNRIGDQVWWITDCSRFINDYPEWGWEYNLQDMLAQVLTAMVQEAQDATSQALKTGFSAKS